MGQCLVFPSKRTVGARQSTAAETVALRGLRAVIGAHEASRSLMHGVAPLQFGSRSLDGALPWGGLPSGTLHEIAGTTAAAGFAAALASRLPSDRPILWCRQNRGETNRWYGPGLIPFGLDPSRIIFVDTWKKQDLLWAMEEGLRSAQPALVIGETDNVGLVASRRLQLAAEAGGATALLLNVAATRQISERISRQTVSSVALTRWMIATPRRSGKRNQFGDDLSQWQVDLIHCRGGIPRSWLVEWKHEGSEQSALADEENSQGRFSVVAQLLDRQRKPQAELRQVS